MVTPMTAPVQPMVRGAERPHGVTVVAAPRVTVVDRQAGAMAAEAPQATAADPHRGVMAAEALPVTEADRSLGVAGRILILPRSSLLSEHGGLSRADFRDDRLKRRILLLEEIKF